MVVTEIFKSIQGESTFAGLPCVFVRLTGCNLRCHCATRFTPSTGAEEVRGGSARQGARVGREIGGDHRGEPLLQKEVYPLTGQLLAESYQVLIETSGERFVGDLPPAAVKIVDVKCPGSGESGKFCVDNLAVLGPRDQVKFVILDEADYVYAREFLARHDLRGKVGEVIFSPVFGPTSHGRWRSGFCGIIWRCA